MSTANSAAEFEPVIGLEIHVQLNTNSKLFCSCAAGAGDARPNTYICPVCTGQPGTLPVLNKGAVELGLKAAMALSCKLNERSVFARKNYFYPDLPKGYQISQYELPLAEHGRVEIEPAGAAPKTIGITRVHMEEDAGKLLHAIGSEELDYSLVDFNRCGIPLIEIVSDPDMRSAEEAYAYLTALKAIMQWSGISNCDMEKGELRVDVNLSVRPRGQEKFGTKVEIKNLNSFKAVKDAIQHEISRQCAAVKAGEIITQQTRLWNDKDGKTAPMRSKEMAHDYRYFPDPDLVPLAPAKELVEKMRAGIPELPAARRDRLMKDYALTAYDAGVLVTDRALADYFEDAMKSAKIPAKPLANWLTTSLLGMLNADKKTIAASPVKPAQLAELVGLVESGKINGKMGKEVFEQSYKTGKSPKEIVEASGLSQISDEGQLETWAKEAIAANPKAVEDFKKGKETAAGSMVGFVMKKSKGKANPAKLNEIIRRLLSA
ncbi:MAG: Asp-tRNA(Asn)/Glu-tRNA(Gln) amidotransferase subunit GatB [Elusimicrobiales bacterium]|nr:Asp-tRNA(Asn)/Glu-tRNA(Gln) amidotransferase subunit GatB [Elusimicrobiales bacterium]